MGNWSEQVKNITEALGIIVGGAWALYRFGLFREKFPSMEIQNGILYIGENSSEYLLELFCIVENKGKVRKWIAPLEFELLFLKKDSPFERNSGLNNEVNFKSFPEDEVIGLEKNYWVLPTWHIPFVDGESKKKFNYIVSVPKHYSFLSLYTRFIDFNSRTKAIEYIRHRKDKNTIKNDSEWNVQIWEKRIRFEKDIWDKTSWEHKIDYVLSKKTDFYYTQTTVSIDSLKQNRTQL